MSAAARLLTERTVIDYLHDRGVLDDAPAQASALGGGVSNVVLSVTQGSRRLVVKQSLPQLKVADEWFAPVERIVTEGRALALADGLVPGAAPALIDMDDAAFIITMASAPADWTDWKVQLMGGHVDASTAAELGAVIGHLHRATANGVGLHPDFRLTEPFEQLRIDPYYRTSAARAPELAERITELIADLAAHRSCLVHGDLSPKNILVPPPGEAGLTVIDWEVAHFGDPAFDLAFLLTHLTMKSIHLPSHRAALDRASAAFLSGYGSGTGSDGGRRVFDHLGVLLVARVIGKSPAEYLSPADQRLVFALGSALLTEPISELRELLALRDRMTA